MLRDPDGVERKFLQEILGPAAGRVLEVGCGDGRLTGHLAGISERVIGLDPDRHSLFQARSLHKREINLILGSGEHIPLADSRIDTVIFTLSLHHHPDPVRALAEADRVLRENGRVLVLEPEPESAVNRLFRVIHKEDHAYERAASAIDECVLGTQDHGTYRTLWNFADFEELVRHLYSYFDLEPDRYQVEVMGDIMGDRIRERPLKMEDSTRWWLLHPSR